MSVHDVLVREVQVPSGSRPAWVGVAAAGLLAERKVVGLESYGVELIRGYGGDPWVDVLEELADAVAYAACSDDRWLKEFLLTVLCDVVWARGR